MNWKTIIALGIVAPIVGQTLRVETRVLAIDTIVRDGSTRRPVEGLKVENFRVKLDGKERPVSYFSPAGSERKPLAMLLVLNLAQEGALRYLVSPEAAASVNAALAKLAPEDEVSVIVTGDWFEGKPLEVSPLGKDRRETLSAMERAIVRPPAESRTERKGERTMTNIVERAVETATRERPDSQVAVVYVSDGMNTLDVMAGRDRNELAARLRESNISFSSLRFDMLANYAAAAAVINPMGKLFGLSVTGAAAGYANETGGVTIEVEKPELLGNALAEVLSAYASRYSLGITLGEDEYRKYKEHRIEVSLAGMPSGAKYTVSARKRFRGGER